MKKFIVVFIILILLGGAAFFFGWMNIWVPADSYAVMVSKSSGYDDTVIGPESGFVWRWQHLLPTNMTIYSFSLSPYTTAVSAKGSFPSADVYAQSVPYHPDFSYDVDFSVSYRLRPKALLGLVKNEKLTPETLKSYYERKKNGIASALLDELFGLAGRGDVALLENPFSLEKRLLELLRDKYADIDLTSLAPRGVTKLPDPAVYSRARANFEALAAEQSRLELEKLKRGGELFGKEDMAFDRSVSQLERYGELFNKYPVLLKYLFITRNPGAASSQVPELKDLFESKGPATP
ncbi:MAG: hypothetical protein JXD23_05790 [Spirochaetales bacterium]|nr:hypothetical protein [Spirochaetales bacterium]